MEEIVGEEEQEDELYEALLHQSALLTFLSALALTGIIVACAEVFKEINGLVENPHDLNRLLECNNFDKNRLWNII